MRPLQAELLAVGAETLSVATRAIVLCARRLPRNLSERVILFLVTKIARSFEATLKLYELGFREDAEILSRSILEAYAKACYIAKGDDPEKLAKELLDFTMKRTAKAFKRAEAIPDPFYKDMVNRIDSTGKIRVTDTKEKFWAEEKIPNILPAIGNNMVLQCYEWYDALSDVVHSNARVVGRYLAIQQDFKPYYFCVPLKSVEPYYQIHSLCVLVMMALEVLCSTFSVPMPEESRQIKQKLINLQEACGFGSPGNNSGGNHAS